MGRTITVFGSGSERLCERERERARVLGAALARQGLALCNGGYGGTMAAAAEGARGEGGATVGVTLADAPWGGANEYMDRVEPQTDLFARIRRLIELGDGYAVLAGGTGTLAELGILLELLGKSHVPARPTVLLGDFWRPLVDLMAAEKVFRKASRFRAVPGVELAGMVACTESAERAAEFLALNLGV